MWWGRRGGGALGGLVGAAPHGVSATCAPPFSPGAPDTGPCGRASRGLGDRTATPGAGRATAGRRGRPRSPCCPPPRAPSIPSHASHNPPSRPTCCHQPPPRETCNLIPPPTPLPVPARRGAARGGSRGHCAGRLTWLGLTPCGAARRRGRFDRGVFPQGTRLPQPGRSLCRHPLPALSPAGGCSSVRHRQDVLGSPEYSQLPHHCGDAPPSPDHYAGGSRTAVGRLAVVGAAPAAESRAESPPPSTPSVREPFTPGTERGSWACATSHELHTDSDSNCALSHASPPTPPNPFPVLILVQSYRRPSGALVATHVHHAHGWNEKERGGCGTLGQGTEITSVEEPPRVARHTVPCLEAVRASIVPCQ